MGQVVPMQCVDKMIDIIRLYQDRHIPYKLEGHKHVRAGWVGVPCCYCQGNPGFHLGYSISGQFAGRFVCWRCGAHPVKETLSKLLNVPEHDLSEIFREYGGKGSSASYLPVESKTNVRKKAFKYPGGISPLLRHHAAYLERRGFDPEKLVAEWGIFSTGPLAPLETGGKIIDYKHRVMIPIEWEGKTVSFQGRDVTGRHKLKYMACPKERELIEHKRILYGRAPGDMAVLVEGVTDVWKLGEGAICCFGVKFKLPQIRVMAKWRKRIFVLFDPDQAGQDAAGKIRAELGFRGIEVIVLPGTEVDPGDMKQADADSLMRDLGFKR